MIRTVLDEEKRGTRRKEGQGGKSDEEEGGTRRKERRGGSRDEKERGTRRKERRGERKNHEVLKRIKKSDALLTPRTCLGMQTLCTSIRGV